jgi:tRNA(Ile)-lysidine synthase
MTTPSKTRTERSKKPSAKRRLSSGITPEADAKERLSHAGRKLLKRIIDESDRTNSIPKGKGVLIAFSGGPDSTALFRILVALRKKFSLRLAAAHVNYRIRGDDSEEDERAVTSFCKAYDIPLFVLRPKRMVGKNEEALRDIRYDFLEKTRKRIAFDAIATAHTQDDQAETVLMRLLRGAGTTGLSGMRPKHGHIIRPLLHIRKNDLISFLNEESVPFRTDKTNQDTRILRNRIRGKLLPLLEKEYQPNIRKILANTAAVFSAKNGACHAELPIVIRGSIAFRRDTFLSLPESAQSDELRRLFRLVSGTGKNPGTSFIREVKKLIESPKNKIRRFESGQLKIEARGDTVVMIRIS